MALAAAGGMLAESAKNATLASRGASVARGAPAEVVATFAPQYNFAKQFCDRPENRGTLERALGEALGCEVRLTIIAESPQSPSSFGAICHSLSIRMVASSTTVAKVDQPSAMSTRTLSSFRAPSSI